MTKSVVFWLGARNAFELLSHSGYLGLVAAFPNIAHDWLLFVFEFSGALYGVVNIVKTLYFFASTRANIDGRVFFLLYFLGGVLQSGPKITCQCKLFVRWT